MNREISPFLIASLFFFSFILMNKRTSNDYFINVTRLHLNAQKNEYSIKEKDNSFKSKHISSFDKLHSVNIQIFVILLTSTIFFFFLNFVELLLAVHKLNMNFKKNI